MTDSGWRSEKPKDYRQLVDDQRQDSEYIREKGLKPNVLALCGNCADKAVLDVGCGTGWLLDALPHRTGRQCDVAAQENLALDARFSVQSVCNLTYPDSAFDVVVSSLAIMWVEDFDKAFREMRRVLKIGGRLVLATTHPYFYRTGEVVDRADGDGDFKVDQYLGQERAIKNLMIADSVGPFTYYHRPMPMYFSTPACNGLEVSRMEEWHIDMADYARAARQSKRKRSGKVPLFAFFQYRAVSRMEA